MTMDRHATIGAMLDEYALGQLSQDERRDVERHVRECDLCAADLRGVRVGEGCSLTNTSAQSRFMLTTSMP